MSMIEYITRGSKNVIELIILVSSISISLIFRVTSFYKEGLGWASASGAFRPQVNTAFTEYLGRFIVVSQGAQW